MLLGNFVFLILQCVLYGSLSFSWDSCYLAQIKQVVGNRLEIQLVFTEGNDPSNNFWQVVDSSSLKPLGKISNAFTFTMLSMPACLCSCLFFIVNFSEFKNIHLKEFEH